MAYLGQETNYFLRVIPTNGHAISDISIHVWQTFSLAFYLTPILAFYLTYIYIYVYTHTYTYSDNSICHIIWDSTWHSIWHSIWHIFWHSIWHSIWHTVRHSISWFIWDSVPVRLVPGRPRDARKLARGGQEGRSEKDGCLVKKLETFMWHVGTVGYSVDFTKQPMQILHFFRNPIED